jgi:NAD(P) transhydrogenase subunit beta
MSDWRASVIAISYFISAFLFIFGLKRMSAPPSARSGNGLAAVAMALALAATFLDSSVGNLGIIATGMVIGAVVGIYYGRTVKMTAMPQMVALFNGMGGGTAALVSVAEFMKGTHTGSPGVVFSAMLGAIIGALSFTGSIVAFGKLQELLSERPVRFPGQMVGNAALTAVTVVLGALVVAGAVGTPTMVVTTLLAGLLGVLVVLPIGGADMPVVIALLNSATGIAAALTGFVLENQILIVAGALVGASGTLLTLLMARAMNRPISNVLFSGFGTVSAVAAGNGKFAGSIREASAEDVAVALVYSRNVVIVPGYGLAVAQAQQTVRELSDELVKRGVTVRYAIHPVAGRMPGHMNVVLADANVPYDQLSEMESINGEFPNTDVVLVIGANDVVNPAARSDRSSPIYGMPILDVDRAKNVIVLKRSMNPGFAGIDNELFYRDNTRMLFGDARASLNRLVSAVKLN